MRSSLAAVIILALAFGSATSSAVADGIGTAPLHPAPAAAHGGIGNSPLPRSPMVSAPGRGYAAPAVATEGDVARTSASDLPMPHTYTVFDVGGGGISSGPWDVPAAIFIPSRYLHGSSFSRRLRRRYFRTGPVRIHRHR